MICELQKRNTKGEIVGLTYSEWDPEPDIIVLPEFDRKEWKALKTKAKELNVNDELRFNKTEYHRMDELTWVHFVVE